MVPSAGLEPATCRFLYNQKLYRSTAGRSTIEPGGEFSYGRLADMFSLNQANYMRAAHSFPPQEGGAILSQEGINVDL